jgi:hypothetical protein
MNRALKLFLLAFAALVSARADTIFNACLAPPGYINGIGNSSCGFTELTATTDIGSVTLALGVVLRYQGEVFPESANNYYVPGGNAPLPHSGAAWGFPFSITTSGGNVVGDFTYLITITDTTQNTSVSFDPTTLPDNVYYTGGSETTQENLAVDTLLQNSETLSFPFLAGPLNYSSTNLDTYVISLSATPVSGPAVDPTVSENINITPEPAGEGLIGAGLIGLAMAARRRSRRASARRGALVT